MVAPLTQSEQSFTLSNPKAILELMNYHDEQQAHADSCGAECEGNKIRREELRNLGVSIIAKDPGIWEDSVLKDFGLVCAPCIYYMRDNHTFRLLPLDVNKALEVLRAEFDEGNTYGMLCSKHFLLNGSPVHAGSLRDWRDFERRAHEWLTRACGLSNIPKV